MEFIKKGIILYLFSFLSQFVKTYYLPEGQHKNITLNNFTYGSCFYGRESERLDIFKSIAALNPQMWFWLGDVAYIDVHTWFQYYKNTMDVNFTYAQQLFDLSKAEPSKIIIL
jgi:hypothetical protein